MQLIRHALWFKLALLSCVQRKKNKKKHGSCMQSGEKETQTTPYSFLVFTCQMPRCMYATNAYDFTCGIKIQNFVHTTNIVRELSPTPPPRTVFPGCTKIGPLSEDGVIPLFGDPPFPPRHGTQCMYKGPILWGHNACMHKG